MKLTTFLTLAAALPLLTACQGTRHAVQLGGASLDDAYAPVDQQLTVGWAMSKAQPTSGIGYELGAQVGGDFDRTFGVDVLSTSLEFWGGPRYEFVLDGVRPYVTGGLSFLASTLEVRSGSVAISDDDADIGLYAGGGVDFDINDNLFLGLGVRQTFGHEPQLFGTKVDGDFTQFFVRFGGSI